MQIYERQTRRNVTIERFGFLAVVRREGLQDWRVFQRDGSSEFGRYRSRGHAVSAILRHFYNQHALARAEQAKADVKITAMHARLTPPAQKARKR